MEEKVETRVEVEEIKRITEELRKIEELLNTVKTEQSEKVVKELLELIDEWDRVYRCLVGSCRIVVDEYVKTAYLYAPVTTDIEIKKTMTLEELYNAIRQEISKKFNDYLKTTVETIKKATSVFKDEISRYINNVENIRNTLYDLKDEVEELKEELSSKEEEEEDDY